MAKYISRYFGKSSFALVCYKLDQKQKLFREGFALNYLWPSVGMGRNSGTPPTKCSATNPGFGVWDLAWNFIIRVKFGTCEQSWDFFWTKIWEVLYWRVVFSEGTTSSLVASSWSYTSNQCIYSSILLDWRYHLTKTLFILHKYLKYITWDENMHQEKNKPKSWSK